MVVNNVVSFLSTLKVLELQYTKSPLTSVSWVI